MMKFLSQDSESDVRESADADAGGSENESQEEGCYLTTAQKDKSVKRGTILVAAVFVAGLLFLLIMVKKTGPSPESAQAVTEDIQIETAISKLTGIKSEFLKRMDKIVKKFYELANVQQIEVYELQKNPFMYEKYFQSLAEETESQDDADSLSNMNAMIQNKLLKQLEEMQLLSIMERQGPKANKGAFGGGSNSRRCMINDTIVRKGDYINGFQVAEIKADCVELRAEGMKFFLRISSD